MVDYSMYVPKVHFEQIPIKNLVSNQEYQRNLSFFHIRRTVENFDLNQINPVKISRRNGINYVFNGQHTVEIIAMVSGSRDTPVWCMIYDDLEYSHEADIFANQQKHVKSLKPYEIFMANIEAGNDTQLIIKDLVESYGLVITPQKVPGGICAVATLEYIHQQYGFHVLDRALRLCVGTWEGEINSLSSNMLRGIARLVDTYGDSLRDDSFKEKIGNFSAREISRTARDRKAGALGYAEALLNIYNKGKKSGLHVSRLYTTKPGLPNDCEFLDADDDAEADIDGDNED